MNVRTENAYLTTTGGKVWPAARSMFKLVEEKVVEALENRGKQTPLRILELGSGCGWLGMNVCARFGSSVEVVMTEQENGGACEWLQHNLSLNPHIKNASVRALDWSCVDDWFKDQSWDMLIGSELVYSPITCQLLPDCVSIIASGPVPFYYAHNLNRFEILDIELVERFQNKGFSVSALLGDSLPTILNDVLFADLKLEIFSIQR